MTTRVDHNYPHAGDLRVVNASAEPVEDVEIRIFTLAAFLASQTSTWVAATTSDINGEWVDPVFLDDGQTYVVHMQKKTMYGPAHVEITT
jgi:hypothetical protein